MGRCRAWGSTGGWIILGAILLGSSPSLAAEPTKTELAAARDLFVRAEHDEDGGRWADAVEKLRRAASVKMTPGIRFHIALCEEQLGQLVAALGDYTAAEAGARSEGNKEVLDAVLDPIAALRARVPTLTIVLPVDVRDAEVTLDGGALATGLLGTAVPVDVGPHVVMARAPGRTPFSSSVSVTEKQGLTIEVHLARAAVGPPGTPSPATMAPAEERSSNSPGSPRAAAIGTTVAGVAVVGFGVASYFIAGGKQSTAETQCLRLAPTACDDFKSGVRTWDTLALSAWIVGAGLGAVSVYLWTRPTSSSERAPTAQLRVGPGSLRLVGEF
jgi:hypothetical protein